MNKTNFAILVLLALIFIGVYAPKENPPEKTYSNVEGPITKVDRNITLSREMLALINKNREGEGCRPVFVSHILEENAQKRAENLYVNNQWSHDRYLNFIRTNYDYIIVGENLARDFQEVDSAMVALMDSEPHRENILNCDYTEVGFGFYGNILVQFFGRPSS
jgi:uncharacterized protein YkwD